MNKVRFNFLVFVLVAFLSLQDSSATKRTPYESYRDNWYREQRTWTDLPRVFVVNEVCPAVEFYLDCNRCSCPHLDARMARCYAMGCPPIPQIVNWKNGMNCPPGQKFFFKCNDCKCHENGVEATCSDRNCPVPPEYIASTSKTNKDV